jgi:putative ABC transport system permease protein
MEELKRMPWVKEVSTCNTIPLYYASGNNIRLPENPTNDLFNIADLYWVSDNYFTLMEIPFIEGHAPGNPQK